MRVPAVSIYLLLAIGGLFAQEPACPQIYVDGPTGIGQPGEPLTYSVRMVPSNNLPVLSYLWSVTTSKGEVGMVRGQGTQTIHVPWNGDDVSVTLKVIGLPVRCPDSASASFVYDEQPVAEKLDEFVGSLSKAPARRFETIVQAARRDPHAQLYLVVSGKRGSVARSIRSKRDTLTARIVSKLRDHRVTFVDTARDDDRVFVWLVPPGAELPKP